MGARHYRDLICWQLADELRRRVFAFTAIAPAKHDRDYCNDVRQSARSADANIAEGFGRETQRDFANLLSLARGSLTETENHLDDALECGYLTVSDHQALCLLTGRAVKALTRLQSYLLRTPGYRRPL